MRRRSKCIGIDAGEPIILKLSKKMTSCSLSISTEYRAGNQGERQTAIQFRAERRKVAVTVDSATMRIETTSVGTKRGQQGMRNER